eukprot:13363072-Alexandrium_andersonii.AAC.1
MARPRPPSVARRVAMSKLRAHADTSGAPPQSQHMPRHACTRDSAQPLHPNEFLPLAGPTNPPSLFVCVRVRRRAR